MARTPQIIQPLLDALGWRLSDPSRTDNIGNNQNRIVVVMTTEEVTNGASWDILLLFTELVEGGFDPYFQWQFPAGVSAARYNLAVGWDEADNGSNGDIDINGWNRFNSSASSSNPERTTTNSSIGPANNSSNVPYLSFTDYGNTFANRRHSRLWMKFYRTGRSEPPDPQQALMPIDLPTNWSGRGTADNPFSFKVDRAAPNWATGGYVVDVTEPINAVDGEIVYFGNVELPGGALTQWHVRYAWDDNANYDLAGGFVSSLPNLEYEDTSERGTAGTLAGGTNRAWTLNRVSGRSFADQRRIYMVLWPVAGQATVAPRPRIPGEPEPPPPQAPTPNRVRGVAPTTTTSITVQTEAEAGATSYRILYGETTIIQNALSTVVIPPNPGEAITETIEGLQPGTRYIFWLAITREGEVESEPSARRGLWTIPAKAPMPAAVVNTEFAILGVADVQGADRYRWRVWPSTEPPDIFGYLIDSVTELPTFQTPDLTQGTIYSMTVEAGNNSGYGEPSDNVGFLLDTQTQDVTTTITREPFHRPWQNGDGATIGGPIRGDGLDGVAQTLIYWFEWDGIGEATSYDWEIDEGGGVHSQNTVQTSGLYLRPLQQFTDYRIRVRGRNRVSEGPWSQWYVFTTVLGMPPKPPEPTFTFTASDLSLLVGTPLPTNMGIPPALLIRVQANDEIDLSRPEVDIRQSADRPFPLVAVSGETTYARIRWELDGETSDDDVEGPWSDVAAFAAPELPPARPDNVETIYQGPTSLVVRATAGLSVGEQDWRFLLISDELALTNFPSIPALGVDDAGSVQGHPVPTSGNQLFQYFVPDQQPELVAVEAVMVTFLELTTVTMTVNREVQGLLREVTRTTSPVEAFNTTDPVLFVPDAPVRLAPGERYALGFRGNNDTTVTVRQTMPGYATYTDFGWRFDGGGVQGPTNYDWTPLLWLEVAIDHRLLRFPGRVPQGNGFAERPGAVSFSRLIAGRPYELYVSRVNTAGASLPFIVRYVLAAETRGMTPLWRSQVFAMRQLLRYTGVDIQVGGIPMRALLGGTTPARQVASSAENPDNLIVARYGLRMVVLYRDIEGRLVLPERYQSTEQNPNAIFIPGGADFIGYDGHLYVLDRLFYDGGPTATLVVSPADNFAGLRAPDWWPAEFTPIRRPGE